MTSSGDDVQLKLTVSETNTRSRRLPDESFASWVIPLAGITTAGPASPIWDRVRPARRSTGSAGKSAS